jgi:hypothetical protein
MQDTNVQMLGYEDRLNEAPNQTYRQLDATSLRTLRIIMHSCMCMSRALQVDNKYTR